MKHSREQPSVWWFATATKKGVFVHTGRCYICRLGKGWECSALRPGPVIHRTYCLYRERDAYA